MIRCNLGHYHDTRAEADECDAINALAADVPVTPEPDDEPPASPDETRDAIAEARRLLAEARNR